VKCKQEGRRRDASEPLPDTVASVIAAEDTSVDDEGRPELMSVEFQLFLQFTYFL